MAETKNAQPRVRLSARNADLLAGGIGSEFTPEVLMLQTARLCRHFGISPALAALVAELAFSTKEATQ